ncbi:CRISPR-associated protein Cas4 [uncultured Microscilla sp.]|uniref:CRISPR-associated protein Cas4 n=1 Tax=uncultured Microscilla sp. TaxID=432653 RepID=UPI00262B62B8|nr:CRISPR-associated protein Cas4 [uncultured Microscilla sp.]
MISVTPSEIIAHLYCPRFTYFLRVLNIAQHEDRHYKVQKGRQVHESKTKLNPKYLRQRLGVVEKHTNVYLTNKTLRGEIDEVLMLANGRAAPLDYKFAVYEGRVYQTYLHQLYCYAWLIEDHFGVEVTEGFLVYTRSRNKVVPVEISPQAKQAVKTAVQEMVAVTNENIFPKATKSKKRCATCTYRNVCPQ